MSEDQRGDSNTNTKPASHTLVTAMSTVLRIKRRLDEEPTENIFIKAKRSRSENADKETGESSNDMISTMLVRAGTVESKEDPIEPLVFRALKKGSELKANYKKLGSTSSYKEKINQEVKKRSVSKRYKIICQNRGIGELPPRTHEYEQAECVSDLNNEGATATPSVDVAYFDAVLANEKEEEDVITCNGVVLESVKYVYDVFYSKQPVNWQEVMEQNLCRIETEVFENVSDTESEPYEDEDDSNEEDNWRNDYPDYDDSPYEDEEDYLNSQLKKHRVKRYDTDESYDEAEYNDCDDFDPDGNLIMGAKPYSLIKLMKNTRLDDSNSDSE